MFQIATPMLQRNQSRTMGAKAKPTLDVPCDWKAKSATRMAQVMPMTASWVRLAFTCRPCTADNTAAGRQPEGHSECQVTIFHGVGETRAFGRRILGSTEFCSDQIGIA
jgi:hypothetical protein